MAATPVAVRGNVTHQQAVEYTRWTVPAVRRAIDRANSLMQSRSRAGSASGPASPPDPGATPSPLTSITLSRLQYWKVFSDFSEVVVHKQLTVDGSIVSAPGDEVPNTNFLTLPVDGFAAYLPQLASEWDGVGVPADAAVTVVPSTAASVKAPSVPPSAATSSRPTPLPSPRWPTGPAFPAPPFAASGTPVITPGDSSDTGGADEFSAAILAGSTPIPTINAAEVFVALILLCDAPLDDKLALLFDIFDVEHTGRLDLVRGCVCPCYECVRCTLNRRPRCPCRVASYRCSGLCVWRCVASA